MDLARRRQRDLDPDEVKSIAAVPAILLAVWDLGSKEFAETSALSLAHA